MGTISTSPTGGAYAAGANAVGQTVSDDIQTIVDEFNGNVDTVNLKASAVTAAKIAAGVVDNTKLAADSVRQSQATYNNTNTGMVVAQCGPGYGSGNGGFRIARVQKTGVTLSTASSSTQTVVFDIDGADCAEGSPGFSAAPTMLGGPIVTASDSPNAVDRIIEYRVTAISSTEISIEIKHNGSSADVTIEFGIMGPLAE